MSKELGKVSLLDILPQNLLGDKQIEASARALDVEIQKTTAAIQQALILPRLDVLPEKVLDLLAWQWHVDFYEPAIMSLDLKRKLIRESIALHRIKGTKAAVEFALRMVYYTGEVTEWFEYGGEPYYFRVSGIRPDNVRSEELSNVLRLIFMMKNARSWLEGIGFVRPVRVGMYYGVLTSTNKQYRIVPLQAKDAVIKGGVHYGVAVCPSRTYCIISPQAKDAVIKGGTYRGAVTSVYREVVIHE